MHLRPYLTFNGQCAEAMAYYQSILGGKLDVLRYRDTPDMPAPPGAGDLVMHARLVAGDHVLMASDAMPGQPYAGMHGFGITLAYDTAEDARRTFAKLATGGQIGIPMEKTFWAEAFGMVTDRYGTPWLINGKMLPAM